jgi:hypothetical protein
VTFVWSPLLSSDSFLRTGSAGRSRIFGDLFQQVFPINSFKTAVYENVNITTNFGSINPTTMKLQILEFQKESFSFKLEQTL